MHPSRHKLNLYHLTLLLNRTQVPDFLTPAYLRAILSIFSVVLPVSLLPSASSVSSPTGNCIRDLGFYWRNHTQNLRTTHHICNQWIGITLPSLLGIWKTDLTENQQSADGRKSRTKHQLNRIRLKFYIRNIINEINSHTYVLSQNHKHYERPRQYVPFPRSCGNALQWNYCIGYYSIAVIKITWPTATSKWKNLIGLMFLLG